MKMLMILLVSAAVVLVSPATPVERNRIIDIIDKYNSTLNKELYVESVEHLFNSNNRCSNAFFCKVHDILVEHKNTSGNTQDESLLRNLKQIIQKDNCEEKLATVKSTSDKILFTDFLHYFKRCIQCRNTKASESSC